MEVTRENEEELQRQPGVYDEIAIVDQLALNKLMGPKGFDLTVSEATLLPMNEILSDQEFNCRGDLKPIDYVELARSIAQVGLLQAIIVTPYTNPNNVETKYRIVVGHCRFAACKHLKWTVIPAVIKSMSEDVAYLTNAIENLERRQLNIKQEAKAVNIMTRQGLSIKEIAERLNKSSLWVDTRKKFVTVHPKIQEELVVNQFNDRQLNQLLSMVSQPKQFQLLRKMKEEKQNADKEIEVEYVDLVADFDKQMREKRYRKPTEISEMKDLLYAAYGACAGTIALAWAAGSLSSDECYDYLIRQGVEDGVEITKPRDMRDSLVRKDVRVKTGIS